MARPTRVAIAFHADADFADQFELRSDHRVYDKPGAVRTAGSVPEGVVFDYRRDAWHSSTTIAARPAPVVTQPRPERSERVLTWHLDLPAHGSAELTVTVAGLAHGARRSGGALPDDPAAVEEHVTRERCEFTRDGVPAGPGVTVGDGSDLARACARGLDDLARLLVPATGPDGEEVHVPGAGVPWFLTLFGRDSLLTSYFALPYRPGLAHDTLRALAATQAVDHDPARGAEPGKIVHEIRHGELAHFGQVPYGRYYGSVDSTPSSWSCCTPTRSGPATPRWPDAWKRTPAPP